MPGPEDCTTRPTPVVPAGEDDPAVDDQGRGEADVEHLAGLLDPGVDGIDQLHGHLGAHGDDAADLGGDPALHGHAIELLGRDGRGGEQRRGTQSRRQKYDRPARHVRHPCVV
ncbi:MAG: hypothetical protein WDN45_17755 [Caulobacteraceae bacterium]